MTCATAWLQSALQNDDGIRRLVVIDEAWAVLSNLAIARWLQAGFKLARAFGAANVAVVHRLSDLRAAGAEGSEQQRLAEGLLADSETRVIFGQPPSEVESATDLLGLTSTEADLLPRLPRGVALWKVGQRAFLVEHRLGPPRGGPGRHRPPNELVHVTPSSGRYDLRSPRRVCVSAAAAAMLVWLTGEMAAVRPWWPLA